MQELHKAVQLSSSPDGVLLEHLADALDKHGQDQKAIDYWQQAKKAFRGDGVNAQGVNEDVARVEMRVSVSRRVFAGAFEVAQRHIEASEAITQEVHQERATLWNRMRWWTGWVLVSVLDYTVARRLNLGI